MRKEDIMRKGATQRIFKEQHIPIISKYWDKYGYPPSLFLNEEGDFYNVLEDFMPALETIKKCKSHTKLTFYGWQGREDISSFRVAREFVNANFCGFYDIKRRRYLSPPELFVFSEWYVNSKGWTDGEEYMDKYCGIIESIAAFNIAVDVSEYLDEKSMYHVCVNERNIDKFLKFGPHAGEIFDPKTMCYRKAKDFEEYAYHIHTDFWFHDPSKGYKPDAKYKWNFQIPLVNDLMK